MEISTNVNNYQAISQNQLRSVNTPESSVQPVVKQDPISNTQEVSEVGQANEVRNTTSRANGVDYVAQQSQQSQTEIALSSAGDTASIVESLRDVQKQNNAVDAYAAYKENQSAPVDSLSRGLVG